MENIKEKMTKNKKILIIAIIAIILIVLAFVSVRYITTSTNLQGDKLASSSNAVGVTSVEVDKSETSDATYTINDGGASVSFTATLGKPGDGVNYIISITNNTYDPATIIESVEITGEENEALRYTTDAKEKIISKGETKKINFKITYDSNATEVTSDNTTVTVTFKFAQWGLTYGDTVIYPVNGTGQALKLAGLYSDTTQAGRYYYSGSNPNNAIVFNGEPYRILAFEPDGRIKIMKMVSIGKQNWNTVSYNDWETSTLSEYLEETWLPTQSSGEDYQYLTTNNEWYVGAVSSKTDIAANYTAEKTKGYNSAVGLVSASEYLKSKYTGSTFLSYSSAWWTISPSANYSSVAWSVNAGGSLANSYPVDNSSSVYAVFPVLYLQSSVSLTGTGTATDPYCVSGSSCPTDLTFTQRKS